MNVFLNGIEAAIANAGPEVAAEFKRLKAATEERAREEKTINRGVASCSVDAKDGGIKFVNFDPYFDAARTVEVVTRGLAKLERLPGSKVREKQKRNLESVLLSFQAKLEPDLAEPRASRKDKAILRKLRRKAARADRERKGDCVRD